MYTHLKLKTEYSICSSTIKIKDAISIAKKYKMQTLAICDDGNLFGSLEFSMECVKAGIKPIIGVEMKLCRDDLTAIGSVSFFAKTEIGYRNILKLTNSVESINNSGNVFLKTVEEYHLDVIAVSPSIDALKTLQNIFEKENFKSNIAHLKVFKVKKREGVVERMSSQYEIIGKNMFKKETNLQPFVNLKVTLSTGEVGVIESSFGLSGKVKIRIPGK